MEVPDRAVEKMIELADYLSGAEWPYGSGRYPDSDRYQLEHAKREAQKIKRLLKEDTK